MGQAKSRPLKLAKSVDLKKFCGKWYVLWRISYPYAPKYNEQEIFSLHPDGKILIEHKFHEGGLNGEQVTVKEIMWSMTPENTILRQMSGPETQDYGVIDIDEQTYDWAALGTLDRSYCWIISRKPFLSSKIHNQLISKLKAEGFQVTKVDPVLHNPFSDA